MRKYFGISAYRAVILALSLLVQMALMFIFVFVFSEYYIHFQLASIVFGFICGTLVLSDDSNSAYKIAWIFPMIVFPVFGAVFYLIFGKNRLSKRTIKKMMIINEKQSELCNSGILDKIVIEDDLTAAKHAEYLSNFAYSPLFENQYCEYFPLGEEKLKSLLCELQRAEKYIFMEYFIIRDGVMWNQIFQVLKEKASQGIDVRIIYDDFGCITGLPEGYHKLLNEHGIKCKVFNKITPVLSARLNNRDHRKICVIDGYVGFTGGVNIADEYINLQNRFGHWKDTAVMVKGKAAFSMAVMFLSIWEYVSGENEDISLFYPGNNKLRLLDSTDGYVQPYCDNPIDCEPVGQNVYLNMINSAEKYLLITTPYLIIDNEIRTALCNAAKSGVNVSVITPGIPDKKFVFEVTRSNYDELLKSGVKIYEYTPGFIHAKMFVCDGKYATVGTVNLDYRSLYLHFECGIWMCKTKCISAIENDIRQMIKLCREIPVDFCRKRPLLKRQISYLVRAFAPLL